MKACSSARIASGRGLRRAGLCRVFRAASILATAAFLGLGPVAAVAQTADIGELVNRIDRLQRELGALQREVYRNRPAPAPGAGAPAPSRPAADAPQTSARNSIRLGQLELEIRKLTGIVEELDHRLGRLEGLVADLQKAPAVVAGGADPSQQEPGAAPAEPSVAPPAGGGTVLGKPEGVLGTIAAADAAVGTGSLTAPGSAEPVLPEGSPQVQYDFALDLMLDKNDYATAEKALQEFLQRHAGHRLAGNAYYWLGETHYVRKEFREAALAFGQGFRKHSRSSKAPDTLLRLGMALAELGKRKEACTAFKTLAERFPGVAPRLGRRIEHEQNRNKCR